MDPLIIIMILGFIGLAVFVSWTIKKNAVPPPPSIDPQAMLMLQQRIDSLNQELKVSLAEQHRSQQTNSFQMTGAVRDVTERLVKLEETNKQVLTFSSQLDQLQRILSNPKQRGILGEYYLETLLKNIFSPDQYQMQYKFKDGEIVDAAVFVKDKIVPIDSKFSLENYNRLVSAETPEDRERYEKAFINDLKGRIKETSKYVRPQEDTLEFAFMFIPHEALYYDLLVNKIGSVTEDTQSILEKAYLHYRVIIVSPTSFAAYLQTVLQGLRALKIEEQAKEIRQRVGDLERHLVAYEQYHQNVGKHLGTAVNQYNLSVKEFGKIDKDLLKITGQGTGTQAQLVDRPSSDV